MLTASSPVPFETQASTSFIDVEGEAVEVSLASTAGGTTSVSGWLQSAQGTPMIGVPVELGGQTVVTDEAGFFVFEFQPHQIPTASFSIPVPAGDPWFDPLNTGTQTIPMQRAIYGGLSESGTQQHPNLITSFIDASMVYGSDDVRAAALRSGVGGKLKVSAGDLLPVNNAQTFPDGPLENDNAGPSDPSTLFAAGDVRANENVGLLSLQTLLVREHNRLADQLAAENPGLTDEQLYQQARRLLGAMVQHITYHEYLPVLLGEGALPTYAGYDANVNPAISGLFSGAAFRVGHTQLIPNFQRLDDNYQPMAGGELPLRFAFFNSSAITADGIEPYLRGLYATLSQEVDPYVIDDVRNFLFGPPGSGGMDLASLNIQRGRDMGLPSYNQARADFGLPKVTSFAEITSDPVIAAALASVYDHVDQVDVWVGGLAEDHAAGAQVGPLFQKIIADQFTRSRDGDRYWYENGQFTSDELAIIRGTTLASLIQRNSSATGFSGNVFTTGAAPAGPVAAGTVATQPSTDYRTIDGYGNNLDDPTAGATYDYLSTNYTVGYADGASTPGGNDRPGPREISNAVIAQGESIANGAGTTGLFIFWGQLLDHDLGLTPGGTSSTLTIHGDQWVDPTGYQQYASTSMPIGQMLEGQLAAGGDNQAALPITMLSTNLDTRNVFAHLEGTVDIDGAGVDFNISITPEEFQLHTDRAVIGWKVVAEEGSNLDPAAVQIYDQLGNLIPTRLVQDDVEGSLSSYVVADMAAGDYRVSVMSQDQTYGAFHLEASLTGDFDGDRRTGALDLLQILDTIGFGTQQDNLQLDLNFDGQVTQADLDMAIANFRNLTTLSPVHLSGEVDPAAYAGTPEEGTVTGSHVTFRGQTLPGITLDFDTNSDGTIEESITSGAMSGGFNFVHNIELYEGSHEVTITATDRFGQKAELRFPLTRDTIAPHVVSTTPSANGYLVDGSSANTMVTMTFNEALPLTDVMQALTIEGDQSGSVQPTSFVWDAPSRTLSFELAGALPDSTFQIQLADTVSDAAGNALLPYGFNFTRDRLPKITSISPASGEQQVSVVREAIIRFSQPIDPATVNTDTVTVLAGGQPIAGRVVVSSTNMFATFFPDNPWPASTELRVTIDGNFILTQNGENLDADGDHVPGGVGTTSFRTLPLTRIEDTNLFGYVRDSVTGAPLVGATIRVDAFPEANAVTDADGRFELQDMPAPEFFVHVDGSTATHLNVDGTLVPIDTQTVGYPSVGKPFHTVPGQTEQLNMNGVPFDIFLPAMTLSDMQTLSPSEITDVGFGEGAKSRLAAMMPDVDPAIFDQVKVSFAPGTAVDEQGNAASQAIIIPVAPDRIPAPLPPNFNPELVISIQALGATNFDVPAAVTFPNLQGLAPGQKTFIYSFDHDAGVWKVVGTGTVTPDGTMVESDGGVIQAPGWHFTDPGFFGTYNSVPPTFGIPQPGDRNGNGIPDEREDNDGNGNPDFDDDDQNDNGTPDRDEAIAYRVDVQVGGRFTLPQVEIGFVAGIDLPSEVLGPEIAELVYRESITYPAEPSSVDFGFQFSRLIDPTYDRFIPEGKFNLFNVNVEGGISAAIGLEGKVEIEVDDLEAELEDLELRPGNIQAEFTIEITDSPLCRIPYGVGEAICQSYEKVVPIYGAPTKTFPDIEISLPVNPLLDYRDQFFVGLKAFAGFNLSFSPFVKITTTPIFPPGSGSQVIPDPAETLPDESFAMTTSIDSSIVPPPNVSTATTLADTDVVYYLLETSGGLVQRGRSTLNEAFSQILAPGESYSLYAYSPAVNSWGVVTGVAGLSGAQSRQDIYLTRVGGFDADGDGLADFPELIIGTDGESADTDQDGITDLAEIQQGLDPFNGRGFPTGIIASLPLMGEAKEIVVQGSVVEGTDQTAYIATGSHGMAIVDVSQFDNPIALGQLELTGDAVDVAVSRDQSLAVVAATGAGLHIVDISDPLLPTLVRTIAAAGVTSVEIYEGVIYAAAGTVLESFSLQTGQRLDRLDYGGTGTITGMAREGSLLVTMDTSRTLRITELAPLKMAPRGSLALASGGGRLFVGDNVVYAAAETYLRGGFSTIDISDPDVPLLISGSDVAVPFISPKEAIIPNGSGLGLLLGSPNSSSHVIDVVDLTDLTNTNVAQDTFRTRYVLPASPYSAVIGSGIGFIADGTAGLQVVNYAPFDTQKVAPTLTFDATALDVDVVTPGLQVVEGSSVPLSFDVRDDVQVRNVQLLVNGIVQQNDVAFPFDMSAVFPSLSSGSNTATFELLVTDTGGNVATSGELSVTIVPDTIAPEVALLSPGDQSRQFAGLQNIRVLFSEPMATGGLIPENFELFSLDNPSTPIPLKQFLARRGQSEVSLLIDPLPVGQYELRLNADALVDRAGNSLGTGLQVSTFTVIENTDPGNTIPTAVDLGVLGSDPRFLNERIGRDALDNPDTADIYRFTLTDNQSLNFDFFDHTQRYDVELYVDLDGDDVLDSNERLERWDINSSIMLSESLTAGDYFLVVSPDSGNTDTLYSISITAPRIAGSQDAGDDMATARDMGTLSESNTTALDVVQTGDSDFYRFELANDSIVTAQLTGVSERVFIRLLQDMDGDLYPDSIESLYSGSLVNNLTFSEALAAGTYYLSVVSRSDLDYEDNTQYGLAISASEIVGSLDAGEDANTARDLGPLSETPVEAIDVIQTGDKDAYRFELTADSNLAVDMSNLSGAIYVRLFQDQNGNGLVESNEVLYSTSRSTSFNFSEPLAAGVYFLDLVNSSNFDYEDNTQYLLSLSATEIIGSQDAGEDVAAARDLGPLSETPAEAIDVVQTGDIDFYRFELTSDSTFTAQFSEITEWVYIRLFQDRNGNSQIDSDEILHTAEATNLLSISEPLVAGVYYLSIVNKSTYDWEDNTHYHLSLTATEIVGSQDAGDDVATARDLGTLTETPTEVIDLVQTGDSDFYRFDLAGDSMLQVNLGELSEYVYVRLYRDLNSSGALESNELLEAASGVTSILLQEPLVGGTYYLVIVPNSNYDYEDNTSYRLSVSASAIPGTQDAGDTVATATDLGTLSTTDVGAIDLMQTGDSDFYRFTLAEDSTIGAQFSGMSEYVYLTLFRDFDANSQVDSADILASTSGSGTHGFNEPLSAGDYYLRVLPYADYEWADNTIYSLAIHAQPIVGATDAGNSLIEATDFGTLTETPVETVDTLITGDFDWYRFELAEHSTFTASLSGISNNVAFYLIQDINGNDLLDSEDYLAASDTSGSATMIEPLSSGVYYFLLQPYTLSDWGDNTAYQLQLSAVAIVGAQDAGNDLATATMLGTLDGTGSQWSDVVQTGDTDVFRFTLASSSIASGTFDGMSERVFVQIGQDLDMSGVLEGGEVLEAYDSATTIAFSEGLAAGDYFMTVTPYTTSEWGDNTAYTFQLTAMAIPNSADAGDQVATARDLGSIDSTSQSGADIVQFDDVDIFQFSLSTDSDVLIALGQLTESILVRLYSDTDGDQMLELSERIRYDWTSGQSLEWNEFLTAGTYYLHISITSTANDRDNSAYLLSVAKDAQARRQGETDWNPSAVDSVLADEDLFDPMAA